MLIPFLASMCHSNFPTAIAHFINLVSKLIVQSYIFKDTSGTVKLWEITRGLVTENYGEVSDVLERNIYTILSFSGRSCGSR